MTTQALLYDANGSDRSVPIDEIVVEKIGERQLLWVDISGDAEPQIPELITRLKLAPDLLARATDTKRSHHLDNYGDYFAFRVQTPRTETASDGAEIAEVKPQSLSFVVADRWILTIHDDDIQFLTAFCAQDKGETAIGSLSPAMLATSLLDWSLAEFFTAASHIEADVDGIDEQILANGADRAVLNDIVAARRRVSKLRTLISNQRPIFHGLTRPDFALSTDDQAAVQFKALADRYDRAVDEIERTRDVVIGSFDLFTSMSSEETNDLVKALTFVTVIIGFSAAVAGLLGMNFDAPFFKSGLTGFVVATSLLFTFSALAIGIAKRRKWI
jgi:magnesium transporter